MLTYDNGLFTDDISQFPIWDDADFLTDILAFLLVDAGSWSADFSIGGINLASVDVIRKLVFGIVPTLSNAGTLQSLQIVILTAEQALQSLALGLPAEFSYTTLCLAWIPKIIQAAKQAEYLTSDPGILRNLELQIAALNRAYRLFQQGAAAAIGQN